MRNYLNWAVEGIGSLLSFGKQCLNVNPMFFYLLLLTVKTSTVEATEDSGAQLIGYKTSLTFCPASLASSTFIHEYNHLYTNEYTVYDLFQVHKTNINFIADASIFLIGENHDLQEHKELERYITDLYGKQGDAVYLEAIEYKKYIPNCIVPSQSGIILKLDANKFSCQGWENITAFDISNKYATLIRNTYSSPYYRASACLIIVLLLMSLLFRTKPLFQGFSIVASLGFIFITYRIVSLPQPERDQIVITNRNKNIVGIVNANHEFYHKFNYHQFFIAGNHHFGCGKCTNNKHPAIQKGPHRQLIKKLKDKPLVVLLPASP